MILARRRWLDHLADSPRKNVISIIGKHTIDKRIWLATETDNQPARAIFNKLNARETQSVVVYDWDGVMDD